MSHQMGKEEPSTLRQPPPSYEHACSQSDSKSQSEEEPSKFIEQVQNTLAGFGMLFKQAPPNPSTYDQLKPAEIHSQELVLCASCETFHQRPADRDSYDIGGEKCAANKQKIMLGGSRSLSRWRAHMVMRAQRLSPAHGTEISKLFTDSEWDCWMWRYGVKARAVYGRLLLRVTAGKRLRLVELEEGLDDVPCCRHLEGSEKLRATIKQAILSFTAAGGVAEYKSVLYRCVWCPSEVQIVVRNEAASRGEKSRSTVGYREAEYGLSISRYVDLGRCESTASREWTSLCSKRQKKPLFPSAYAMDGLGMVGAWFEGLTASERPVEAIW